MEIIYGLENWYHHYPKPVVALGNFDGVHLGHQQIIKTALEKARAVGGTAVVMTFEPHPEKVLHPEQSPPLLMTVAEKARLLRRLGIDVLLLVKFSREFAQIKPVEFVTEILKRKLGAYSVVVGYNYRFGHKGEGTPALLRLLGDELSLNVIVVPPVVVNGTIVSSTLIRKLLQAGKIKEATALLGRYPTFEGAVVHGDKLGRKLGFPTANLQLPRDLVLPAYGVYLVQCVWDRQTIFGIANVGKCPTFAKEEVRVEVYLFDFRGGIYGERLRVEFLEFLRPERFFRSPEELQEQIRRDTQRAKEILKRLFTAEVP